MELPFTFDKTEKVRAQYCDAEARKNLKSAVETVARHVETKVLYTFETKMTMDYTQFRRKLGETSIGMPNGSTPMLVIPSVLDEFMLVLKESFPESRIEVTQDGKRELLSIDWTKEEPVTW